MPPFSRALESVVVLYEKPQFYFVIFTIINLLNFMDRGIIPGATNEFINFIKEDINTDTPSLFLGLCQSSFIVGFCIASPIFGHLVHYHGPFILVAWGMTIWCVAVMLSGLAFYTKSYPFLVFARMLSGVGESSLQCAIPPWIAANATPKTVGTWVSIFYTAIPVGTALGYAYSAVMAGSVGWQWGFFVEGLIMFPFVIFLYAMSPSFPLVGPNEKHFPIIRGRRKNSFAEANHALDSPTAQKIAAMSDTHEKQPPKVLDEFLAVIKLPVYDCICFGYAAQTAALIGISTFGSAFLMGMGYFGSEEEASFTFGAAVSLAGILGTPIGGALMDKYCTNKPPDIPSDGHHHYNNTKIMLLIASSSALGTILMCTLFSIENKALYILIVTVACTFIFLAMSGANMATMMATPLAHRSFAIALCSITIHLLGDVPSPIITGYIKDQMAPDCIGDDDEVSISEGCRDDEPGLRLTMLLVSLWLWWTVFFYFLGAILSHFNVHSFSRSGYTKIDIDERALLVNEQDVINDDEPVLLEFH
jgi:MFS family permease